MIILIPSFFFYFWFVILIGVFLSFKHSRMEKKQNRNSFSENDIKDFLSLRAKKTWVDFNAEKRFLQKNPTAIPLDVYAIDKITKEIARALKLFAFDLYGAKPELLQKLRTVETKEEFLAIYKQLLREFLDYTKSEMLVDDLLKDLDNEYPFEKTIKKVEEQEENRNRGKAFKKSQIADQLKISRPTLDKYLKVHGIKPIPGSTSKYSENDVEILIKRIDEG